MKEKIRYFVAGIFIGLSELLPGISGATVALMFGVYEKILNFMKSDKKNVSLKINLILLQKINKPILNLQFSLKDIKSFLMKVLNN